MKKIIAILSLLSLFFLYSCSDEIEKDNSINQEQTINNDIFEKNNLENNLKGVTEFIIDNDGMTYDIVNNENLEGKAYFAVAVYSDRTKEYDVSSFSDSDAVAYTILNQDLLKEKWHNLGAFVSDGKVYLDVSLALPKKCKDEIMQLGAQYNNRMIYDLEAQENLPVGPNLGDESKGEEDVANDLLELQGLGCLD